VLASRYGIGAIDMVHRGEFGCMVALRGNDIVSVPLTEAINKNRLVDPALVQVALGLSDPLKSERR
jgi:6-phosphofructokinase 1